LVLISRAYKLLGVYLLIALSGVVVLVISSFPTLRAASTFTAGVLLGLAITVASVILAILQIEERALPGAGPKPTAGSIFQLPGGGRLAEHANFDIDLSDENDFDLRSKRKVERYIEHPVFLAFVAIMLLAGAIVISFVAHSAFTWGLSIALWISVVAFAVTIAARLHPAG
jgi:predicted Kef-type K+ transport protein